MYKTAIVVIAQCSWAWIRGIYMRKPLVSSGFETRGFHNRPSASGCGCETRFFIRGYNFLWLGSVKQAAVVAPVPQSLTWFFLVFVVLFRLLTVSVWSLVLKHNFKCLCFLATSIRNAFSQLEKIFWMLVDPRLHTGAPLHLQPLGLLQPVGGKVAPVIVHRAPK